MVPSGGSASSVPGTSGPGLKTRTAGQATPARHKDWLRNTGKMLGGSSQLVSVVRITPIYKPFSWPFGRGPTTLLTY